MRAREAKLGPIPLVGHFRPKTWPFWRCLILCFCVFCIVGHWIELGYCIIMDGLFSIVEDDYAIWFDPWYHPYWVYGFGIVFMTLIIEPIKERALKNRKTLLGAFLQTFIITVLLSMVLECGIGLLVNQPNEFGEYPYWDNSKLPLNVLNQAWLVNDVFMGIGSALYVWIIYPLISWGLRTLRPHLADSLCVISVVFFICLCMRSYTILVNVGILG